MLIHWIWFSQRPGLSDRARAEILQHFQDAEDVYFADAEAFTSVDGLSEEAVASLQDKNLSQAEEILGQCAKCNIHILTWRDAAYPMRLKAISDPPVVLYYKGKLPQFDALPAIAIVGTRDASAYGLTVAKRMGSQIASCGGLVVSGMASGIDGMAMGGALTADMPVVGVLGCGADVIYPRSNRSLFADTEKHGCLLTEFPPGTPPAKWNFPRRNRIISGISCGVLVVEAPEKSGALITARQAADQGRDVFVVPGNIDVASCKGSNALLRDGGIPVSSGWDVLSEYEAQFPGKLRNSSRGASLTVYPDEVQADAQTLPKVAETPRLPEKRRLRRKKEVDNTPSAPYIDAETILPALTQQEEGIVQRLQAGQMLVDDLIAGLKMPAGQVLSTLTMLEIKGVITRLPGKRIGLKNGK